MHIWRPQWMSIRPGIEMLIDSRDYISRPIVSGRGFEPLVCAFIREHLTLGAVFLDVGANAGLMSLLACDVIGSAGRVIAFEPNPAVAELLRENVRHNHASNVQVVEAAVSDSAGILSLYVSPYDNTGKSSVSQENARSKKSVQVAAITLDSIVHQEALTRVDLIKIDVEGHEMSALKGARETLRVFHPTVIVEIIPAQLAACGAESEQISSFFESLGFASEPIDEYNSAFFPRRHAHV